MKLYGLENELRELIAASAHRTLMTEDEIGIELEDYGSIRPHRTKPETLPEEWDPDGRIRNIYAKIVAIKKRRDAEKTSDYPPLHTRADLLTNETLYSAA
jgi:hypothetical protein